MHRPSTVCRTVVVFFMKLRGPDDGVFSSHVHTAYAIYSITPNTPLLAVGMLALRREVTSQSSKDESALRRISLVGLTASKIPQIPRNFAARRFIT